MEVETPLHCDKYMCFVLSTKAYVYMIKYVHFYTTQLLNSLLAFSVIGLIHVCIHVSLSLHVGSLTLSQNNQELINVYNYKPLEQ